jgi:predicted metal-dependent phosphoesterase TrpH
MHTDRSDGRFPVDEVLARCARGGLDVVAITDHDLGPPLEPGPRDIEGRSIHLLGAAEISGMHDGHEHHLLVYFATAIPTAFHAFCAAQCRERAERYERAAARLGLYGLPPVPDDARRGERALTRLHLARALVTAGHAASIRDAFDRYLSERHGIVPPFALTFTDAIRIARSHGGITSWAHPSRQDAERYTAELAAAGLEGMEALRPSLDSEHRRVLRKIAHRHGLWLTGGSDWHGWTDEHQLGLFRVTGHEIAGFVQRLGDAAAA